MNTVSSIRKWMARITLIFAILIAMIWLSASITMAIFTYCNVPSPGNILLLALIIIYIIRAGYTCPVNDFITLWRWARNKKLENIKQSPYEY